MREIKFRAWHKSEKQWENPDHLFMSMSNQLIGFANLKTGPAYHSTYEIMQFTGLHDKNGKEIYEGDIINLGENGHAKPSQIAFNDGSFCIIADWISDKENPFIELSTYCNPAFIKCVEIIGNIYENPELIK